MKVVASHAGGKDGHHVDERLEVLEMSQGNYANVDTTTLHGLKKAKSLGLVQSKEVNVIFTPYVQEAAVLFDKNHRGRFVTILRDPVDRITSLYYYRRIGNRDMSSQSLEEFVQSSGENWMVRMLTGSMSGYIDAAYLNAAKEILRSKFLIGLLDEKTESLRRFEEYFWWTFPSPVSQTCKNTMFYFEWHGGNPHPQHEGEAVLEKIRSINLWDMALYEYAKQLFKEQKSLFWNKADLAPFYWKTEENIETKNVSN
jgi:hypothetical protein